MSWISEFLGIKVKQLAEVTEPTHLVTVDGEGVLGKVAVENLPGSGTSVAMGVNIDGGFANAIYTISENIEGGSASTAGIQAINGGNAEN